MFSSSVPRVFKFSLLLLLMTTMITSKSIDKRIVNEENEVEGDKIKDSTENNSEKTVESVERKDKILSEEKRENEILNIENSTDIIGTTTTEKSSDNSRSQRTIGHLREVENPLTMIENFKNKLKTARNNIQEQLSRKSEPRIFIFDPKNQPGLKLSDPLKPDLKLPLLPRTVTQKPETNPKKETITPTLENSSSQSSEEVPPKEETKNLRNTEKSTNKETKEVKSSPDTVHLLHVKEEIDKLRNIMQVLREQQLKQQFGSEFPHTQNLTTNVHKELTTFVDKMKNDGKIFTSSLPGKEHPPDTNKLMEDIKHLRESVLNFAHQVGTQKVHDGNFEKLVAQINQQRKEIEDLKKLVDELQSPKQLPAFVKNPHGVKKDFHQELKKLQEILNDLMKKEEQKASAKQMINPNQLRQNQIETVNKPIQKPDEESETIMKILQTIAHPGVENKQSAVLEAKLEKLERDLKNLDLQNQRTRQELVLDRLEKEIDVLKSSKLKPRDEAIKPEKIKGTEALNGKISSLEKQMKQLPKQQSVQLDSDKIEKELEKLQREIDILTKQTKSSGKQMTPQQIDNIFNDTPQQNDSPFTTSLDKLKGVIKHPLNKFESLPAVPIVKPNVPIKVTEETIITKPENPYPAVFQIPYCLQKNPHFHYPPSNVEHHPYPPVSEIHPITVETIEEHHPIKTIEHILKPKPQPLETIKIEKIPLQPIGHKEDYHEPSKIKVEENIYNKPEVTIKNQSQGANYNNEHDSIKVPTTDYNKEHVYEPELPKISPVSYQPTIPKATPVKIEYHSYPTKVETPNLYPYSPEQIHYKTNEYKPSSFQSHAALEEEINHLHSMIGNLDEKIGYSEDVPDFEYQPKNYRSSTRQKRSLPEDNNELYNNIQERLSNLRQAVENIQENQNFGNFSENELDFDFGRAASSDYYQPYNVKDSYGLKKRQKFDDLFIKIVKFVLHKLEISAPFIVDSLFNGESYVNDDNYKSYREADEESDLYKKAEKRLDFGGFLNNFQGFNGLLGFIPTILLKLLSNFSSFLSILKRNNFFKNFLFPGGLILAVDGILALLIWWFSTDDNLNLLTFQNNSSPEYVHQ